MGASEIEYLGHYPSTREIRGISYMVEAIKQYHCPKNLRRLRPFLGMISAASPRCDSALIRSVCRLYLVARDPGVVWNKEFEILLGQSSLMLALSIFEKCGETG